MKVILNIPDPSYVYTPALPVQPLVWDVQGVLTAEIKDRYIKITLESGRIFRTNVEYVVEFVPGEEELNV